MFLEHLNHAKPVEPFVLVIATAGESYQPGEALTIGDAGTVTKCTGNVTPDFICQTKLDAAEEGAVVSATLVNPQQMLEAPLEADGAALKAGDKVTVGTDGLTVTATTDGVFLITEILGTAVGDTVRGYFMR